MLNLGLGQLLSTPPKGRKDLMREALPSSVRVSLVAPRRTQSRELFSGHGARDPRWNFTEAMENQALAGFSGSGE
jgi:hypothetical protein